MILELGLLCNVYIVYLLLRSYSGDKANLELFSPSSDQSNLKDYHVTTRRISKVLLGRITSLVLLSQLIYITYWWLVSQELTLQFPLDQGVYNVNNLELYLFDGLILISNNSLLYLLIINIFAFLSFQVFINGLGSYVAIDGTFINNTFNNLNNNSSALLAGEACLILIGNIIGINLVLTSNNFIITLIAWELVNICIYSLISINNNKTKVLSNSIKYFIISAVSTTLFILGITLIYMETGSFNLTSINYQINMMAGEDNVVQLVQFGVLFIYFTVMLKLGGAPLHFWAPDLYSSQPSNVTQWLLIVPKLGNLFLLLNLYTLFNYPFLTNELSINYVSSLGNIFILLVGIISILVGSISLLSQIKIKRFFTYSSICHVGFLLLCLGFNGFNAYIHYTLIYALTTLSVFIIIGLYNNNNLSFLHITSYKFNKDNIYKLILFIIFSINLFSLAGMPPLAGFFAKLGVLGSILTDVSSNTQNFINGMLVILLFILASIISAYNYIRLVSLQLNIQNSSNPDNLINKEPINMGVQNTNPLFITARFSILYDILAVVSMVLTLYIIL